MLLPSMPACTLDSLTLMALEWKEDDKISYKIFKSFNLAAHSCKRRRVFSLSVSLVCSQHIRVVISISFVTQNGCPSFGLNIDWSDWKEISNVFIVEMSEVNASICTSSRQPSTDRNYKKKKTIFFLFFNESKIQKPLFDLFTWK